MPPQAKGCLRLLETGRDKKEASSKNFQKEHTPANTMISDLQLSQL
jgi:hypothetical protein